MPTTPVSKWYCVHPEVPGGLGPATRFGAQRVNDTSFNDATALEITLDDWLGDDLLTVVPFYLVTPRLATALIQAQITGFQIRQGLVMTISDKWFELHDPADTIPAFQWIAVSGRAVTDAAERRLLGVPTADLSLTRTALLVASERVIALLRGLSLQHAIVEVLDM